MKIYYFMINVDQFLSQMQNTQTALTEVILQLNWYIMADRLNIFQQ